MAEKTKQAIKELSLLLMTLTGWEEDSRNDPEKKVVRCWKGYSFEILNELEEEGFITQFGNAKSCLISEEGQKKALELKEKLL